MNSALATISGGLVADSMVQHFPERAGIVITFPNGYGLSIVYGPGTYSSNHDLASNFSFMMMSSDMRMGYSEEELTENLTEVEVGILDKDSNLMYDENEDVYGYCSPEKVMELAAKVAAW